MQANASYVLQVQTSCIYWSLNPKDANGRNPFESYKVWYQQHVLPEGDACDAVGPA
jgi:hypothetical protein